jgi:ketosteroid isomerase-like protein
MSMAAGSCGRELIAFSWEIVGMRPEYQLVHEFFDAVTAGELPDALLTEDMTGWITTGGTMDKPSYQGLIRILALMCAEPIRFTVDSITAEQDRAVAEVRSSATLVNGEPYAQTYIYVFRIRDGRIASVAEHYNALISEEKLIPLMKELQQS